MEFIIKIIWYGILVFLATGIIIVIDGLTDKIRKSDVIVVLGNKVETNGIPSKRLQSRLDTALGVYNTGVYYSGIGPLIIVSGGFGKEGFEEATIMKEYLVKEGIPPEKIIEDRNGTDSFETARNSSKIMKDKNLSSVTVVSNYYHISRTRLAFKKFGVTQIYSAHADFFEVRDPYSIVREVIGFYYYLLRDTK